MENVANLETTGHGGIWAGKISKNSLMIHEHEVCMCLKARIPCCEPDGHPKRIRMCDATLAKQLEDRQQIALLCFSESVIS
jgi:uncharacterized cupin superfamily protein